MTARYAHLESENLQDPAKSSRREDLWFSPQGALGVGYEYRIASVTANARPQTLGQRG